MADAHARDDDVVDQDREYHQFIDKYVGTLSAYEYMNFLVETIDVETAE